MNTPKIELTIQNPFEYTDVPIQTEFQRWVNLSLNTQSCNTKYSVVIRITDDAESQQLNLDFRDKDAPTNVLSFPFEMPDLPVMEGVDLVPELEETLHAIQHLGDLVLCKKVVQKEITEQNKTMHQHWAHLVIHGMLHLQGFDHINDDDAKTMESLEIKLLQQLDFPNPYETQ